MPSQPCRLASQASRSTPSRLPTLPRAIGSGDLEVLGTPRLLAWMEGATCAALADHLLADETSVGTRVVLEHQAASPVGAELEIQATLVYVDGRLVRFEAVALDSTARVVGRAEITRVIVDREQIPGAAVDRLSTTVVRVP